MRLFAIILIIGDQPLIRPSPGFQMHAAIPKTKGELNGSPFSFLTFFCRSTILALWIFGPCS